VQRKGAARWRWAVKTALASTISRVHDHGLGAVLGRRPARPLVLGYHRVVDDFAAAARTEMPNMLTSARMFEHHLDYIGRHFRFVSIDEIGKQTASGVPFSRPVAAVTFDDGYRDVYEHAYPILKRKGIPAAVFVVTDLVGRPSWQVHDQLYQLVAKGFATWDDPARELAGMLTDLGLPVRELLPADATRSPLHVVSALLPCLPLAEVRRLIEGIEVSVGKGFCNVPLSMTWPMLTEMQREGITIGSHTRSHVSLPMESDEVIVDELQESKWALEQHLGGPVLHFAYPGGQFTPAVVDAVARAGYRFAYTACTHGVPKHPALTIERLLLWEGSSADADGRFSPAILNCQAQDLWPPVRRCERVHSAAARFNPARSAGASGHPTAQACAAGIPPAPVGAPAGAAAASSEAHAKIRAAS
jgi:peptidoglycan/xylan/chitin deacetylase (PgdA/CDA1 family)